METVICEISEAYLKETEKMCGDVFKKLCHKKRMQEDDRHFLYQKITEWEQLSVEEKQALMPKMIV